MKALILQKYNQFFYENFPKPVIGSEEVLIQVIACGICGSDVHGMDGSTGRRQPPIIMGHEAAGIIAETGPAVKNWSKGDRVTFDSTIYCGQCWFCKQGQINLCDNRRVLGVSCNEYRRHGAMAQYVAVPQHILYRLPDNLSFEHAAMVEALSIAVHAVSRLQNTKANSVVVVGAGMIGLLIVQMLKVRGIKQITAVDLEQDKLSLAVNLGATHALRSDKCDVPLEIRKLTEQRGTDIAFEAVGITPAINIAVNSLRKGGTLVMVGNLSPAVEFPLQSAVTRELSVLGSCASSGEYPVCLDLMAKGKINVVPLISATAPLSEGAKWFERLYKKEHGLMKVILKPWGGKHE